MMGSTRRCFKLSLLLDNREGLMPYDYSSTEISLDTMYAYYKQRYDRNRGK